MMKIRLIKSRKAWMWDQYLPEHMKWDFGSFMKPRNQETKKPKAKHQGTKKPSNQETKKLSSKGNPSTPQLLPLHPTTLLGDTSELPVFLSELLVKI